MVGGRLLSAVAAGSLVFVACGGGLDDGGGAGDGATLPDVDAGGAVGTDVDGTDGSDGSGSEDVAAPNRVDLIGEAVVAASDLEENPLPDVVLDDVQTGRKVNFRNLVPQEKPILLWMYAPH